MPTLNIGKVRYTVAGTFDSTSAYDALVRVQDENGIVYESIKAAPAGTVLTNTAYWIRVSGPQGPQGVRGIQGVPGPKGDPGEAAGAVLYTSQSITTTQQAQARTNIGFNSGIEAYWKPILKELILANGGTQAEIDAIENGS